MHLNEQLLGFIFLNQLLLLLLLVGVQLVIWLLKLNLLEDVICFAYVRILDVSELLILGFKRGFGFVLRFTVLGYISETVWERIHD